jgi:putative resolvase
MEKAWIRLSEWANRNGVSKMTAWRMAVAGEIPGAQPNAKNRWMVPVEPEKPVFQTVAYARVSSHDQKHHLDGQVARIADWAAKNGVKIDRFVREVGSGLNEKRRELAALLSDPAVGTIVVEHRDRLARFGVRQIEQALAAGGRRVIIVEPRELDDDLVQDMIDLMTCFSARLYGKRSARNRARLALRQLAPETGAGP